MLAVLGKHAIVLRFLINFLMHCRRTRNERQPCLPKTASMAPDCYMARLEQVVPPRLHNQVLHNLSRDIGQAVVSSLEAVGQAFVI